MQPFNIVNGLLAQVEIQLNYNTIFQLQVEN